MTSLLILSFLSFIHNNLRKIVVSLSSDSVHIFIKFDKQASLHKPTNVVKKEASDATFLSSLISKLPFINLQMLSKRRLQMPHI